MKTILFVAAFFAAILDTSAFGQGNADHSVQPVIQSYLNIKNALTLDKTDSVKSHAKTFVTDILAVTHPDMTREQHSVWMKYAEDLERDANIIAKSTDLKKQRKAFKTLSTSFYSVLKAMQINTADLFYQYCPMADAYWISESSDIRNPYYGKQMSSCGSTKETLKAQ